MLSRNVALPAMNRKSSACTANASELRFVLGRD